MSTASAEEILEERGGLRGEDAFHDLDAVIEEIGIGQLKFGPDSAEAEIAGAEGEGADAGVNQGAGAHDAGFQRYVDRGVVEAVILFLPGGGAEEVDFRVRGGIVGGDGGIVRAGDDLAVNDENGADRDFALGFGENGLLNGGAHIEFVIHVSGGI